MMKWLYVALASSVAGLDYESLEASQDLVSRGVSWLVRYDTTLAIAECECERPSRGTA